MSLVRYEPWGLLNQLHGEIDRLFDNRLPTYGDDRDQLATSDWVPAVDIREEDSRYVIHADVPGVKPEDIEVQMEDGVLSVRVTGKAKPPNSAKTTGASNGYAAASSGVLPCRIRRTRRRSAPSARTACSRSSSPSRSRFSPSGSKSRSDVCADGHHRSGRPTASGPAG